MTEQDNIQLQRILEGAILAAGEPLSIRRMQSLFGEDEMPDKEPILEALAAIKENCDGRGFDLIEVASGWRFQVREDMATWVNRLWEEKPQKYSRALLETIALIAYRQPLTRGDIEEVRGVAVSSHIIKTLTERDWVKVVGHRDVPGRPALYATTKTFLDYFNLKSLDELPTLGELKDIESLNQNLAFESPEQPEGPTPVNDESTEDGQVAAQEGEVAQQDGSASEQETLSEETDVVVEESEALSEENDAFEPEDVDTESSESDSALDADAESSSESADD